MDWNSSDNQWTNPICASDPLLVYANLFESHLAPTLRYMGVSKG